MSLQSRAQADAQWARERGDRLNFDAEGRANTARQGRAAYQNYADEAYDPLIGNRGGYNAEEQAMIFGDMRGYMGGQQDFDNNFMSPEEFNATQGNPWSRGAYFDPESDTARTYESSGRTRGAADSMAGEMYGAIGDDLGLDSAYTDSQRGTIAGTAGAMRGAVDPSRLRADGAALDRIRMSPQEQQRMVTGAGITTGNQFRSTADDLARRSRAAGMSPGGIAAMQSRFLNNSAAASGDAMTLARVRAGESAANRAGAAENFRMRGEESAADRGLSAAEAAGRFEFGSRSDLEGQRLRSAQDRSNRRMDTARAAGAARIGVEEGNAAREQQGRQFNTTTGTGIATGVERDSAERAAAAAQNRQAANRFNIDTRFGQGMTANNAMAGRAMQVGNARRQDAAEGRDYLQRQIAGNRSDEQNDYNRQAGIYGTQGGLMQGATRNQMQADQLPRWWERAIGAGTQIAGAGASLLTGGFGGGFARRRPSGGVDPGSWQGGG